MGLNAVELNSINGPTTVDNSLYKVLLVKKSLKKMSHFEIEKVIDDAH